MNFNTLIKMNWIAFVVHLALGLTVLMWYLMSKEKNPEAIDASLWDLTIDVENPTTPSVTRVTRSNADALFWCMIAFIGFTALAHLFYATNVRGMYEKMMVNGNNWMRWIEYAISATILLYVVFMSSGAQDFNMVFLSLVAVVGVMLTGDSIEKILANPVARATRCHWGASAGANLVFIGVMAVLIRMCVRTFQSLGEEDIPWFVPYVTGLTVVLYSSFGILQLLQCGGLFKNEFIKVEVTYIALSFAAKATLALLLTSGIVARSNVPPSAIKE